MKLKYTLIALTLGTLLYAEQVKIDMHGGKESTLKADKEISAKPQSAIAEASKSFSKKDSYTIEELYTFADQLKGETVTVKGKVTKVSKAIMGKDWVHLNDGTGSEADKTNDLTLTTKSAEMNIGEEVTAKGKLVTNKDLGSGYFYKVIIEESSFTK